MNHNHIEPPLQPLNMSVSRHVQLTRSLPGHLNVLQQRRGAEIPLSALNDYIALGWIRWAGRRLVITHRGVAVRDFSLENESADEI